MTLTIKEKEHWKERISTRIQKAIDHIYLSHGIGFKEDVRNQAKLRVIESLGIKADYELAKSIDREIDSLNCKQSELEKRITDRLRELGHTMNSYDNRRAIELIVNEQAEITERNVLQETESGRAILRMKDEQEQLLDTVWLATSPTQIRNLWVSFNELIGDQPTELQQKTLLESPPSESE